MRSGAGDQPFKHDGAVELERMDPTTSTGALHIVVDRLVAEDRHRTRLHEAIETAWKHGDGICALELFPRDGSAETLHRHLLWTIYLNDGFDEGETEFLFQRRRIVPRTGSVLIAPTAFTHTHRGNRPQGGDKFIATGWILFQPAARLFGSR